MINFGKVQPGSTIYIPFESFSSSTGAPITITGLATSDILVYKDGSTTQRASASGFTLLDTDGIDFDGITGIHGFSIDLSDNTTADFWASGSKYIVVISTVTVDSQTMSFIAATFSIGESGAILDTTIATLSSQTSFTLTSGPAEDDAINGRQVVIHDAASAVQQAFGIVLDYTGSTKTVTLAAAPTFTIAAKDNISVMLAMPLQPTTAGNTLDVATGGEAGVDWGNVANKTTTNALTGTTIATTQKVDVETIKTNPVVNAGTVTFPTGATLASTTNITGGTITTVTTVTSQLTAAQIATGVWQDTTAGDFTAANSVGKSIMNGVSLGTGLTVAAVSGAVGSVTGAVGSVTGNVGGNVTGSVGSVAAGGITASSIASDAITAAKIADGAIDAATFSAGAINAAAIADGAIDRATFAADTGLVSVRSNTAQSGASGSITLDASASATDDFYKNELVLITGGTGVGQARTIGGYTGSSKVATVSPNWATNPDNTSTFAILPAGAIAGATAPTATEIRQEMDSNSTQLAAILADTAEIGTAGAGLTNINLPNQTMDIVGNITGNLSGSVGSVTGAVGSVTGNVGGNVTGSVGSVAAGGITASSIAADAIGASELASDAVAEIATAVLTTQMTESYRSAGSAPTLAQAQFETIAHLGDSAFSGTTKTLKNIAGTTAKTFTLDSSTAPTSITETT